LAIFDYILKTDIAENQKRIPPVIAASHGNWETEKVLTVWATDLKISCSNDNYYKLGN
jgi:hypothetical protein